jgi:hypothetical protein
LEGLGLLLSPFFFLKRNQMPKNDKTRKVSGVDLSAKSFLYVGDLNDTSSWLLPVHVPGDLQKTINLLKNHLARFYEMKNIPPAHKNNLWIALCGACKAYGIPVDREAVIEMTPEEFETMQEEMSSSRALTGIEAQSWV